MNTVKELHCYPFMVKLDKYVLEVVILLMSYLIENV